VRVRIKVRERERERAHLAAGGEGLSTLLGLFRRVVGRLLLMKDVAPPEAKCGYRVSQSVSKKVSVE
jgi:hypothetical protein